jgi:hypothetical protein
MSPIPCPPLPSDTAQAAELVFGRDHPYLQMGNALEAIWTTLPLSHMGETDTFLVRSFHPYSLVTLLQYWETLTDRQMSQATRMRLDMKYALHLPLSFPGIEPDTLCEFRQHVLASPASLEILGEMLRSLSGFGKRESSTRCTEQIIASICLPSRAESILDVMDQAIEAVAAVNPEWLKDHTLPHWYRRYHLKIGHRSLPADPGEVETLIESVGNDGWHLLTRIKTSGAAGLSHLPEIRKLHWEWQRQFFFEQNTLTFRESHCRGCSSELQVIKNTIKRKETGKLVQPQLHPLPGGNGREPGT